LTQFLSRGKKPYTGFKLRVFADYLLAVLPLPLYQRVDILSLRAEYLLVF